MPKNREHSLLPKSFQYALGGITVGTYDTIAVLMTKQLQEAGVHNLGQLGLFLLMDFVGLGMTSWYLKRLLSPKEKTDAIAGRQRGKRHGRDIAPATRRASKHGRLRRRRN